MSSVNRWYTQRRAARLPKQIWPALSVTLKPSRVASHAASARPGCPTVSRLTRSGSTQRPNFMPDSCANSASGRNPLGNRSGSAIHVPRPLSKSKAPFVPAPGYHPASSTNNSIPSAAVRLISLRTVASSTRVPYAYQVLYVTRGVHGRPWRIAPSMNGRRLALTLVRSPAAMPKKLCGISSGASPLTLVLISGYPAVTFSCGPSRARVICQAPDHWMPPYHVSPAPSISTNGTNCSDDRQCEFNVNSSPEARSLRLRLNASSDGVSGASRRNPLSQCTVPAGIVSCHPMRSETTTGAAPPITSTCVQVSSVGELG